MTFLMQLMLFSWVIMLLVMASRIPGTSNAVEKGVAIRNVLLAAIFTPVVLIAARLVEVRLVEEIITGW